MAYSENYILSENIKVFPCAYRGQNGNTIFDPEARLNTEYNFTHTSTSFKRSYIVKWTDYTDSDKSKLCCVIGGYYFEIKGKTVEDLADKKLCIHIKQDVVISENTKTSVLCSVNDAADFNLDIEDTADHKYYFMGLKILPKDSEEGKDLYETLQVATNTGASSTIKYDEFLPNIQSGTGHTATSNGIKPTAIQTESNTASGEKSFAIGDNTVASGQNAHAEGSSNRTDDKSSDNPTKIEAAGISSHTEGYNTAVTTEAIAGHAEGARTEVSGKHGHSEGYGTRATGEDSHAEGYKTKAYGYKSHTEGEETITGESSSITKGIAAHSEGYNTKAIGNYSHAEGEGTLAQHTGAHTSGYYTNSSREYQTVIGEYNTDDTNALFIIGNGTADKKSNAFNVNKDKIVSTVKNFISYPDDAEISGETNTYGGLSIVNPKHNELRLDTNEIMATIWDEKTDKYTTGPLYLNANGGDIYLCSDNQTTTTSANTVFVGDKKTDGLANRQTKLQTWDILPTKSSTALIGTLTNPYKTLYVGGESEAGTTNNTICIINKKYKGDGSDIPANKNESVTNILFKGKEETDYIANIKMRINKGTTVSNRLSLELHNKDTEEDKWTTLSITENAIYGAKKGLSSSIDLGSENYRWKTLYCGAITASDTISGNLTGNVIGNAATATQLQTARSIGGVSFNGTADIDLPGVNTAGNQNTSGNAATATNATNATNDGAGNEISSTYAKLASSNTFTGDLNTFKGSVQIKETRVTDANGTYTDPASGVYAAIKGNGPIILGGANTGGISGQSYFIKVAGPVEASYFNATSFNATSDKRLKENIIEYKSKKSILDLPIYKYDFINGKKNQIGCLAQDLQEICPEIVSEDNNGYLSIQESKIVYLLLEEVKKLRKEIETLKK